MERKADSVFTGNIITMDPRKPKAEAIAVKDGKIIYVGSKAIADKFVGPDTKRYDYGTNTIYPGFIDSHAHGGYAVLSFFNQVSLGIIPKADAIAIIKKTIEDNPDRDYYGACLFNETPTETLTRKELDELCPDKPLIVSGNNGHAAWLNSKAIELVGLTKEMAKELGTEQVGLDENGELNGRVTETANFWVEDRIPHSIEETTAWYRKWQSNYFALGFTGVGDAALMEGNTPMISAWGSVTKEKDWRMRVFGFPEIRSEFDGDIAKEVEKFAEYKKYENDYLRFPSIKTFMDGVIEGHTGWLLDEYLDTPGYYGIKRLDDKDKLVKMIVESDKHGFSMHIHSVGDGASKAALDAFEEAAGITGDMDQRNAICHLQLIREEDIKRLADLNITAVTPPLWTPLPPMAIELGKPYIGDRIMNMYPLQSFIDAGANMAFHTDSIFCNIPMSIVMAVTRTNLEIEPTNTKECISRMDAIKAMTINVAYMWKQEDRLGSLEVGKLADMSVFHTDFFVDDLEKIIQDTPVATIVNGDVVFSE